MHIALVGMMASGKTTIGRLVAGSLGRAYVDKCKSSKLGGVTGNF